MVKDSSTLKVTAKGQVTFRRSVLDHLGVGQGDRLVVDLLPDGRATVQAAARGRIDDFIGALSQPEGRRISIEEIREVAASGWAGKR